jgi:[NiFe] hydrogenase diaphorase moiety large subunit
MRAIGTIMRQASYCGLGHTARNHIINTLDKFPEVYRRRLRTVDYSPSFDLDAALGEARALTQRDGIHDHVEEEA